MRKMMKWLFCLMMVIVMWSSYALAESGVRFIEYPDVIDLYITNENSMTCGSFIYELEPGVKVVKHSVKLFDEIIDLELMDITQVGPNRYQMDFPSVSYQEAAMDTYGIGDELTGTVYVSTTTGEESVDFTIRLHEEEWDKSRIGMPKGNKILNYEYIPLTEMLYIDKPTVDGVVLPDEWVNYVEYDEEYLEYVGETKTQYIFLPKKVGYANVSFSVHKLNTNLSSMVIVGYYMIYDSRINSIYRLGARNGYRNELEVTDVSPSIILYYELEGISKQDWDTIQLTAECSSEDERIVQVDIQETGKPHKVDYFEKYHVGFIGWTISLKNLNVGKANVVVTLKVPGCSPLTKVIPIEVTDKTLRPNIESLDAQAIYPKVLYRGDNPIPYFTGTDTDKYRFHIQINGMPVRDEVVREKPGLYPVTLTASGVKGERNIGAVSVIDRIHELSGLGETEEKYGSIMLGNKELLNTLAPVKVPTLILPEDMLIDTALMLKYRVLEMGESKIAYDLQVIDWDDNEVEIPEGSVVVFPYPESITIKNAMEYLFTIVHHALKDTEVFSTLENTIALKEAGLCITVNSFSPFEITWEEQPEVDLPQTGDNSHIVLWLAMLILAGTAVLTLRRKTA